MRPILTAKEYERVLRELSPDQRQQAVDAIVSAARELMTKHGLSRGVFLCGEPLREIGELAAKDLDAATVLPAGEVLPPVSDVLICDLLFPSSVKSSIRSFTPILSVGIPAGVDPDTGRAPADAVHADITVAPFGYLPGLFLHDGLDHCGEIRPVGGEAETFDGLCRFEGKDASRLLPPRKRTAH